MTEIDFKEYSVKLGDNKYTVRLGDDGLVLMEGEEFVESWVLEEAELKVAVTVLRNSPPCKEELIFARKACGLNRDMAFHLYSVDSGEYSVESLENGQFDTASFKTDRKRYIAMLMDECLRQLRAIEVSKEVECEVECEPVEK